MVETERFYRHKITEVKSRESQELNERNLGYFAKGLVDRVR